MKPFEITTSLSTSKNDVWDEIGDKDYNSFLINRSFSQHHDTVMLANEMNNLTDLPKKMQYDFYRIAINPKKKRFAKWAKPEEDEIIDLISETYQCNKQKAIILRSVLNDSNINNIRIFTTRGGR